MFADRRDAGQQLGARLQEAYPGAAVVVGLARGGVEVAAEVASALGAELDAVAVRKIGHPFQPEYAIGAAIPGGRHLLREGFDPGDPRVRRAVAEATAAADELDRRLHAEVPPLPLGGAACILVDDGLATGATMRAAVGWARDRGAGAVVVAVPVGAAATVAELAAITDAVVCLRPLTDMVAVGQWYGDFTQVPDDRVLQLLRAARTV